MGEELQLLPTQTRQDVAMVLADPDAEIAPPRRRVLAAVVRNESVPLTARLLVELFPHLGALIPETPRPLPATPSRRMPGWVIVLVLLVGRNVANLFRDPSPKPSAPPRREAGWYPVRESDPALRSPAHDGSTDDQRRGAGPASAPASRPGRR